MTAHRARAQRSWSDALSTPLRSLVAAASLFSATEEQLKGGIIPDGADDAPYRERGARYAGPITADGGGAVAIKLSFDDPNSPTGRSAYWVSGAIYNERTIISAAHSFLALPGLRPQVYCGPNFRTNTASVHRVENFVVNPLFTDKDSSRRSTFDLAVLVLTDPITGTLPATLSTNRPAGASLLNFAGFGVTGTPSSGYRPRQDGFARSGTSAVSSLQSPADATAEFYFDNFFRPESLPDTLRGAPGDSGGPAFVVDNEGRVVSLAGLMVAGSNDSTGRGTTVIDLSNKKVRAFIDQYAYKPELPTLSIKNYGNSVAVSWNYTPDVTLQVSQSAGGPWADSSVPTTTKSGITTATFQDDELEAATLFRLRRGN